MKTYLILCSAFLIGCSSGNLIEDNSADISVNIVQPELTPPDSIPNSMIFFDKHPDFISDEFQWPVGPPEAKGYYDAQPFGVNLHLGEDWNGVGGGNTDLGDPVYSISKGWVSEATDFEGGWGNVVRIVHKLPDNHEFKYVESLYAHLDTILVAVSDTVGIGQEIGTIGNAHGSYLAHLHLELRNNLELPLGGGYSGETSGYLKPSEFIKNNRTIP